MTEQTEPDYVSEQEQEVIQIEKNSKGYIIDL